MDLLIGDVGERFEKQLSADEEQWRTEARDQQADFLKEWAQVFARYRELMAATATLTESSRGEHQKKLTAARSEMVRLNAVRRRSFEQEESLKPGVQTHGHVWLYLNAASQSDPVASK